MMSYKFSVTRISHTVLFFFFSKYHLFTWLSNNMDCGYKTLSILYVEFTLDEETTTKDWNDPGQQENWLWENRYQQHWEIKEWNERDHGWSKRSASTIGKRWSIPWGKLKDDVLLLIVNPSTPKISLVILLTVCLKFVWCWFGECGVGSIYNSLINIFPYSHCLSVWYCVDIVRINSVLITYGS